MKIKSGRRLISFLLTLILMSTLLSATAFAENDTGESGYVPTDPYVLYYGTDLTYRVCGHASPYWTNLTYKVVNATEAACTSTAYLWNTTDNNSKLEVYCVDEFTSIDYNKDSYYKRVNLEDSSFFGSEAAGKLRSIVLNGYPYVSLETLAAASGVPDLTMGEAVHATQLAIWLTSYGEDASIDKSVLTSEESPYSKYRAWPHSLVEYLDEYLDEYNNYANDENHPTIISHVDTVLDYLMNLEPTAPAQPTVSEKSFIDFERDPVLVDNGDGTYNISVNATVNVIENAGDALVLSAVLGDRVVTADLQNGNQTVNLTFENIPASLADETIKLASDGVQTVSDVFAYMVEEGRYASQSLIGPTAMSLPVHAEISVEPERIINFHKTDKIVIGTDENGKEIYDYVNLEGIVFDLYYVADWNEYLSGNVTLPDQEDIDVSKLGDKTYHYPDYTVVTDSEGKATVNLTKNGLPDGVYVIAEREHSAIVEPVAPFYLIIPYTNEEGTGWEYEITVQPKNDVKGDVKIEKDVIKIGNDEASVDAYKNHVWIVGTSIPADIANGKEYVINDKIDNRLDYIGNMVIRVEYNKELQEGADPIEPVILIKDTDYILTVTDNDSLSEGKPQDSFVVELTKEGMKKIGSIVGEASDDYILRTYYDAQINANASMGEEIPNQATLDYTNSVNYHFYVESDIPVVYTAGVRFLKVDAKNNEVLLKGAEFTLYRKLTAEEIENGSITAEYIDGISAAVTRCEFFDNVGLTGSKVNTVTSDENGNFIMYGLEYGTYYLVETKAPDGYNLLGEPSELQLDKFSHLESNTVKIENVSGTVLPSTGGIGTEIFLVLGAILVCVPVVVILIGKAKIKE